MKRHRIFTTLFIIACFNSGPGASDVNATTVSACQAKNYNSRIVPQHMTLSEKKFRFRCLVQPDIEAVYSELTTQYKTVLKIVEQGSDNEKIRQLRFKYKVENNSDLLKAIKPHPRSIAIAQAAIESAWGTSRFFREANNIFGIRPFNKFEPRIAAVGKTANKTTWLRKYATIKASIADYYLVLARGPAYGEFRSLKMKTVDPHKLVMKLNNYSERKFDYVKELSAMIRYNKFHVLD